MILCLNGSHYSFIIQWKPLFIVPVHSSTVLNVIDCNIEKLALRFKNLSLMSLHALHLQKSSVPSPKESDGRIFVPTGTC